MDRYEELKARIEINEPRRPGIGRIAQAIAELRPSLSVDEVMNAAKTQWACTHIKETAR